MKARHNNPEAARAPDDHASGLRAREWYGTHMPLMLTTNLWTSAGLTNGLRCIAHDLLCLADPWDEPPVALIVRVDHEYDSATGQWRSPISDDLPCCLPDLSSGSRCKYIPIPCISREWSPDSNITCTRSMLPLVLAAAVTIHKSQGATLSRAQISISDFERQLGLLFVAISRVRRMEDMALVKPMHGDRLSKITYHRSMPLRKDLDAKLAALEHGLDNFLTLNLGANPVVNLSIWFRHLAIFLQG